jgi:hypothetical protein
MNRGPYHDKKPERAVKPEIPPEVRLVKMLTEQVRRFDRLVAEDRRIQPL